MEPGASRPTIGIVAVQGDFAEHEKALRGHDVDGRRVRRPQDLVGVAGLIFPGGESTAMLKLLEIQGLVAPLQEALAGRLPVLATCAGLILLARQVVDPVQPSFGALDVKVARNGYGRQIHSGTFALEGPVVPPGATGVFIRAPRILAAGKGVEVLATRDGDPVLVQRSHIFGSCFHPELQPNHFVTRMFVEQVRRSGEDFLAS